VDERGRGLHNLGTQLTSLVAEGGSDPYGTYNAFTGFTGNSPVEGSLVDEGGRDPYDAFTLTLPILITSRAVRAGSGSELKPKQAAKRSI